VAWYAFRGCRDVVIGWGFLCVSSRPVAVMAGIDLGDQGPWATGAGNTVFSKSRITGVLTGVW
jgi:hypothetical protein